MSHFQHKHRDNYDICGVSVLIKVRKDYTDLPASNFVEHDVTLYVELKRAELEQIF